MIAYSSTKVQSKWNKTIQSLSHLLYSLGRVVTYGLLGALFGFLGGVATFSNTANGTLLIVAGVAMILAGLSLAGKMQVLQKIEHSFAKNEWYQNNFKKLLKSDSLFSFFMLGMLNGLLPCGFVYFFAITAASTGDPLLGAMVMVIFGLSTIPALFSLGFFVGRFSQSSFRGLMVKLAALAVLLFGLYTMYSGYEYIVDEEKWILDCHE